MKIGLSYTLKVVLLLLCVSASLRSDVAAQIKPVYDQGALGLGRLLKRLNTSATVMMIGAHPDDEDTALLAYLARGENARTAYLSLTRGDGGQNIIGPELGEALGVIRTEELLQARKLDGAEQFFTRAYDYGFSKTLAEAREKWDEKVILCDAVRAIRYFRPLVVVSQFSGTAADGHGQHQFAGYITPLAVKAAADSSQCTAEGPAWQVRKFYVRHGFRATGEPRMRINTGVYDPLLGRSYFEIAMEARSQHRSQEQGVLELKGEAFSGLNPQGIEAVEKGLFDSLDVGVKGIAAHTGQNSPQFTQLLEKIHTISARALSEYDINAPEKLVRTLAEGYKLSYDAEWSMRDPAAKAFLKQKQSEFLAALKLAAGIQTDILSDRETAAAGETVNVAARIFYPQNPAVNVNSVNIKTPTGWTVETVEPTAAAGQQGRRENPSYGAQFAVKAAADAEPDQPYWLKVPRQGDMFAWNSGMDRTFPLQTPRVQAEIKMTVGGQEITFLQPVEFRFADDIRGELRRPFSIVPAVSVTLDQELMMIAREAAPVRRQISASVTSYADRPLSGTISLELPQGWSVEPRQAPVNLERKGESSVVSFMVTIPANAAAGSYAINAAARVGDAVYSRSMRTIAYQHIQTHRTYGPSSAKANVLDLKVRPAKIGYIMGSGDRVPEAIRQMGLNVAMIDAKTLASGDLSGFDVIVVGIRAYQVRADLAANNKRLLDFVNSGGNLIVQYQLAGYAQQNLTPFPTQQGPRVADENAKITILAPENPVLSTPNRITDKDFEGWVQERNLYNFTNMDAKYTGLLEAHDPNEPENSGGLVVAAIGRGKFIYCSYSLFRQLPAGVPGAYRLLANMLSLPRG